MSTETTRRDERPSPAPPRLIPTLRVLYSGEHDYLANVAHELNPGETLIGREGASGTVSLKGDSRVSRQHACITVSTSGVEAHLRDCLSSNGTFLNGEQVSTGVLRSGDLIRVGDSFLLYRCEPSVVDCGDVPELVGVSSFARALRSAIKTGGSSRGPVLILGETGTGKEVVAHAIHRLSKRPGKVITVNCSAVPNELAESLFFGHRGQVFTGAGKRPQDGYFQAAKAGTLFLDEIGEMPALLQPKLLRVLQDGVVVPVGETSGQVLDVRIVAATNRPLHPAMRQGNFREDLYARLSIGTALTCQPLRTRREDILPLLFHFLGPVRPMLTPRLVQALLLHSWPMNVRDVQRIASRIAGFAATQAVVGFQQVQALLQTGAANLSQDLAAPESPRANEAPTRILVARPAPSESQQLPSEGELPREQVLAALRKHRGVVVRAATELGIDRFKLHRLIARLQIDIRALRQSV